MTESFVTRRKALATAGGAAAAGLTGCLHAGEEGDAEAEEPVETMDAYVVAYHWGFTAFDESGEEINPIEVEPGTELRIHAVNDHAFDAFHHMPDTVEERLMEFDALERTKRHVEEGRLPEPEHASVEEMYDVAHGRGHHPDHEDVHDGHGHDDDGHDDGHGHDDGDHHDDLSIAEPGEMPLLHGDDEEHAEEDEGDGHVEEDDGHDHAGGMLDHGFMIAGESVTLPADADEPTEVTVTLHEPGSHEAICTVDCGWGHAHQQHELIQVTEE